MDELSLDDKEFQNKNNDIPATWQLSGNKPLSRKKENSLCFLRSSKKFRSDDKSILQQNAPRV